MFDFDRLEEDFGSSFRKADGEVGCDDSGPGRPGDGHAVTFSWRAATGWAPKPGTYPALWESWTTLERGLYNTSMGQYDPSGVAMLRRSVKDAGVSFGRGHRRPCRVSVVTPTTEARVGFHENLWHCFRGQTWLDKELIVVETFTETPSPYFTSKVRNYEEIVHVRFRGDLPIGTKRNMGVHFASGEIIVNFDDDDFYAPEYIETLVAHLQEQELVALTLSAWYDFDKRKGLCGFVDPMAINELDLLPWEEPIMRSASRTSPEVRELYKEHAEQSIYGYGFSFAYLRESALHHPYPDIGMGEDFDFMWELRRVYGHDRIGLMRDERGLCLHLMHGGNTADSAVHREVELDVVRSLAVCSIDTFKPLLSDMERLREESIMHSAGVIGKFRCFNLPRVSEAFQLREAAKELMKLESRSVQSNQ